MAANTTPALSISDLSFRWQRNGGFALEADRFDIKRGERVLMTAPSGAGKTTLISLMAGIMRPDNGSIRIGDHDLVAMRPAQRDRFRADNIGLIFQSLNLIPYLTALENIVLPLRFAPARLKTAGGWAEARKSAEAMLAEIGLPVEQHGQLPASRLSVGQQQRVAVLRAMIGAPGLIIADEPTSALDADRRAAFLEMLGSQLQRTGAALLMVSHDHEIARHFDRTVPLETIVRTERMP